MRLFTLLILLSLFAVSASAKELPSPGITPDSHFYFLDTFFDRFSPPAAVADEKAAEVIAMAEKDDVTALQIALEQHEKAMEKRMEQDDMSDVARQASDHLVAFTIAQQSASAQSALAAAIAKSLENRKDAIDRIHDPDEATKVAQDTLADILDRAPESARNGLSHAMSSASS